MIAPAQRPLVFLIVLTLLLPTAVSRALAQEHPLTLYDLANGRTLSGPRATEALKPFRLLLVGEHHTEAAHHAAQLRVIRALDEAGPGLSIGLEMFRRDQQTALDDWVGGKLDETAFVEIYLDNWTYPWSLYREIFAHARRRGLPLVGLNVPREITRQVAYHGFDTLSATQRQELEGITCDVTPAYRDFIRQAFGAHGHGNMDFDRFCEAQLVWDTAMATGAIRYLDQHPDRRMVLLAGSAHARKMGVPHQVNRRAAIPLAVLLPLTPGIFEPQTLTPDDADYLICETRCPPP